jgi:outer membrane protein TolC
MSISKQLYCVLFVINFIALQNLKAQEFTSLKQIIEYAQAESPQYRVQSTQKELSYFKFQSFKSNLKPQISAYGNLPGYSKLFSAVTQPDGTLLYLPIKQSDASFGLSLSQEIPLTGGSISLNSDLNRFDNWQNRSFQYNATSVFVRLEQPILGFNALKWDKKIEPLLLEESRKKFAQSLESIAQDMARLYFDVINAQENIRISEVNLANTDENFTIEKKRISLGTTTEDRLLQIELQLLTNRQNLEKSRYNYEISVLALKSTLGVKEWTKFSLTVPEVVPVFTIDVDSALKYARKYRPEFVAFERSKLEAAKSLDNARAARQQIKLSATYGLNRAGMDLGTAYGDPKGQQTLSIGFNFPILDWGRSRAAFNTAMVSKKLIESNNILQQSTFDQEITTLIKNMPLIRNTIVLTGKRDSLASKRYDIANRLYQVGKLAINDLNIAQNEKDNARQEYIYAIRSFWDAYYLIRRLTLYDFENKRPLYK